MTAKRHSYAATLLFAATIVVCTASRAAAQAGLLVPTSTGTQDPKVLSLREMRVDVGLARGYARVNVRQIFENHTDAVQEGTYRFQLPPSAAIGDFAIWDGVVRIPGVILEKRRARAIYKDLTTQKIDPGLLQQGEEEEEGAEPEPGAEGVPASRHPSGGALFSVTVAPIPAWSTKRLELAFQEETPLIEGVGELRLGLVPPDGEPLVAGALDVHVSGDVATEALTSLPEGLPLIAGANGAELSFSGKNVKLDRDLAIRIAPRATSALRVTAFRNPEGTLPDGVSLAPWERLADVPPEKDGFFLFEMLPPMSGAPAGAIAAAAATSAPLRHPPVAIAIAFDTSFSHRWAGLERGYAHLVRVLQSLTAEDRFALVPFDQSASAPAALAPATPAAIEAALAALRDRALGFGSDVAGGVAAAASLVAGDASGRVLLVTDAPPDTTAKALGDARHGVPLVTDITGNESPEAYTVASTAYLVGGAAEIESDLFLRRAVEPIATEKKPRATSTDVPFSVSGGEPEIRDTYPVLVQPVAKGSLSGWIGRYATPVSGLTWSVETPLVPSLEREVRADLPERALDARDLPRRWARARVDWLLARIELEGERREWVEEIIALSKRYNFVTPYTAFLAAPRSLLRPRRITPGDPVLRVECDENTVGAVALLPFGLRLPLVHREGSNVWEGRFLVPEGLTDGRYPVRIVLDDVGGARISETKHFVIDGTAPGIRAEPLAPARPGDRVRVVARTDSDVVFLSARIGDGAAVPLRWSDAAKASIGDVLVPVSANRSTPIFLEAVDAAKNRGFARTSIEVRP